jgi:hypothetical protein
VTKDASENDRTSAVRDTAEGNKHRTITGAIKGLFRTAVRAITRRDEDEPQPRRRSGETGKAFAMAARATLRRAVGLPAQAYAGATAFLSETLDWLNLWHNDADAAAELNDGAEPQQNFLFPHL